MKKKAKPKKELLVKSANAYYFLRPTYAIQLPVVVGARRVRRTEVQNIFKGGVGSVSVHYRPIPDPTTHDFDATYADGILTVGCQEFDKANTATIRKWALGGKS